MPPTADDLALAREPNETFLNFAGQPNIDDACAAELEAAGIEVFRFECFRDDHPEVKTSVRGELPYWMFTRCWYYWSAKGAGIPPEYAEKLHAKYGTVVRVAGHCGCPPPREYMKGFAVDHYHVDTPEGLKALADTIKQVIADNDASLIAKHRQPDQGELRRAAEELLSLTRHIEVLGEWEALHLNARLRRETRVKVEAAEARLRAALTNAMNEPQPDPSAKHTESTRDAHAGTVAAEGLPGTRSTAIERDPNNDPSTYAELTDEQIDAELKSAGIDMEPAYRRLREMIAKARKSMTIEEQMAEIDEKLASTPGVQFKPLRKLNLVRKATPSIDELRAENERLRQAAEAYRDLATCYRLRKSPSEALFKRLAKASDALTPKGPTP